MSGTTDGREWLRRRQQGQKQASRWKWDEPVNDACGQGQSVFASLNEGCVIFVDQGWNQRLDES